ITTYMNENNVLEFVGIREHLKGFRVKKNLPHSNRFTIKLPVKAFHRDKDHEPELTGTFYNKQATHLITIEEFAKIISNTKLGCSGLYVYAYLKMRNGELKKGYDITYKDLAEIIGCSNRTLPKFINELENIGLIRSEVLIYNDGLHGHKRYFVKY